MNGERRKAEFRRQKSEVRIQKSGVRSQKEDGRCAANGRQGVVDGAI
jgi:hypothetical protein